ncbi:MAG: low specificity L-threonine aldolase, partial [bacterium]|nr:low specificity L-threonine aldolase [bacterium]
PSKMRFQSAQLLAYLTDDLWLRLAAASNRATQRLATGLGLLGVEPLDRPEANILFLSLPEEAVARLEEQNMQFYRIAPGVIRFVTSFKTTDAEVDDALVRFGQALAG